MSTSPTPKPMQPAEWKAALDSLPNTPDHIPAFFFAHGHPGWAWPKSLGARSDMGEDGSPTGRPVAFLKDFGKTLVEKYHPKAILVFSAHWETRGERLVSDYGSQNPLLYDYFGFPRELYTQVGFKSKGDSTVSNRVVKAFQDAGMKARTSPVSEPRGEDGRGFVGPGLDHGVFVPFEIMFPNHSVASTQDTIFDIPVIQASIDASLTAKGNEAVGKAVAQLRNEGVLILAGGLTIHTFQDRTAFDEKRAKSVFREWDQAVFDSVGQHTKSNTEIKQAVHALLEHPGCRLAHPRLEHFIPLYIALGAGGDGEAKVLSGLYGAPTFAFGL